MKVSTAEQPPHSSSCWLHHADETVFCWWGGLYWSLDHRCEVRGRCGAFRCLVVWRELILCARGLWRLQVCLHQLWWSSAWWAGEFGSVRNSSRVSGCNLRSRTPHNRGIKAVMFSPARSSINSKEDAPHPERINICVWCGSTFLRLNAIARLVCLQRRRRRRRAVGCVCF